MPGISEVEAGGWGVKRLSLATSLLKFMTLFQKVQVLDNILRWSQTRLMAQAFNPSRKTQVDLSSRIARTDYTEEACFKTKHKEDKNKQTKT